MHSVWGGDLMQKVLDLVKEECFRADSLHGPLKFPHQAYGLMLEELDELWDEIKKKRENRNFNDMQREAIQLAALAVRFIHDLCKE